MHIVIKREINNINIMDKNNKERTYTKSQFRQTLQQYVKDNGYDQFEMLGQDGTYYKPFSGKYFNDYVNYEYWKEHGPHTDEVNGGSIVMPVTDKYLNRIKSKIDDEHSVYFDNTDGTTYRGPNILPEVTVVGQPSIRLRTYPKFGDYIIGHSELLIPRVDRADKDSKVPVMFISKDMDDDNYNILTNNCANCTANVLSEITGVPYWQFKGSENGFVPMYTPPGVRAKVKALFNGIREKTNSNGSIDTFIPMNEEMIKRIKKLKSQLYYRNLKL